MSRCVASRAQRRGARSMCLTDSKASCNKARQEASESGLGQQQFMVIVIGCGRRAAVHHLERFRHFVHQPLSALEGSHQKTLPTQAPTSLWQFRGHTARADNRSCYAVYSIPQESGFVNLHFCGMMEFQRWLNRWADAGRPRMKRCGR